MHRVRVGQLEKNASSSGEIAKFINRWKENDLIAGLVREWLLEMACRYDDKLS